MAYAFAATMIGTTLPTPLYGLYRQRFGFSELMITSSSPPMRWA